MSNLFVLDLYTAKVFGTFVAITLTGYCMYLLAMDFQLQASRVGKLIYPLFMLLALSFCGLQIAQTMRALDHYNQSKADAS